jgi:DNA transposition AAA+ family ATPase
MANLSSEIREFLDSTGTTQTALAREAGVPIPTVSYLYRGVRKNVLGNTQDALRDAMRRLRDDSEDAEGED